MSNLQLFIVGEREARSLIQSYEIIVEWILFMSIAAVQQHQMSNGEREH